MEITLYFAIIGAILMSAMVFAIDMMNLTASSQSFSELQTNQDFIVQKITETIQEASSLDLSASVFDNPNGVLSLNMPDPLESPTKFYLSDSDAFIQKGSDPAIQLNANTITFNSLEFTRITANKAPDQIIIDGELTAFNGELVSPLHLAVSLRQ